MYNQTQLIMISKRLFNKNVFLLNKYEREIVLKEYEKSN